MSHDWVNDMATMHQKFGVNAWVTKKLEDKDYSSLMKFLEFRINFLHEELNETKDAANPVAYNPEEIVDGLIDLCVVAIGTLDAMEVNAYKAWDEIFDANMKKEPGVKHSRPNPLGLPDLIKPADWEGPSHENNHGVLGLLGK